MSSFILFCLVFAVILGWIDGGKKINSSVQYTTDQSPNYFISFFFFK